MADEPISAARGGVGRGGLPGRAAYPRRAVRTVTEAFVRASGSGLVLPRLIPIGDPELDERIGGALASVAEAFALAKKAFRSFRFGTERP